MGSLKGSQGVVDLKPSQEEVLYFLVTRGGWEGSISALSRQLGYHSDSTVNQALNYLIREGYVAQKRAGHGWRYKPTLKGLRHAGYAAFPGYMVLLLTVSGGLVPIYWAALSLMGLPVTPFPLALFGCVNLVGAVLVRAMFKRLADTHFMGRRRHPPQLGEDFSDSQRIV